MIASLFVFSNESNRFEASKSTLLNPKSQLYLADEIVVNPRNNESCLKVQESLSKIPEHKNKSASLKEVITLSIADICNQELVGMGDVFKIRMIRPVKGEHKSFFNLRTHQRIDQLVEKSRVGIPLSLLASYAIIKAYPKSIKFFENEELNGVLGLREFNQKIIHPEEWTDYGEGLDQEMSLGMSAISYYTISRSQGSSDYDSFLYTMVMSSFVWETGIHSLINEDFSEDSVDPLLNSLLGEIFQKLYSKLEKNRGLIFGSENLGSTILTLMAPAESISQKINMSLKRKLIKESKAEYHFSTGKNARIGFRYSAKF